MGTSMEDNLWSEIDNFFQQPPPSTSNRTPASKGTHKTTTKKSATDSKKRKGATTAKKPPATPTPTVSSIDRALQAGSGNRMAENRIQTDLNMLPDEPWFDIPAPDPNHLFLHEIVIIPPEGYWKNCRYKFRCEIPKDYPFSPPKLHCDTLIYHPNIDLSGNVCISILKVTNKPGGWSVERSLSDVLFGLLALFSEPNVGDPLNMEAANLLAKNPDEFKKTVVRTLKGETVTVNNENRKFEKLI